MPSFENIIRNHVELSHFAGDNIVTDNDEAKRKSLLDALAIRKKECDLRFGIALVILIIALLTLVYLAIFEPTGIKTFKDLSSLLGGGSIIALLYYIISLRDELTKIKQTSVIATAVDSATLNTLLLTITSR